MKNRKIVIVAAFALLLVGILFAPIPRNFGIVACIIAALLLIGLFVFGFFRIPANIHTRNLAIAAAILAAVVTIVCVHFEANLGILDFPAVLLSVILSAGSHAPGGPATYSGFIVALFLYLACFLLIYALLLEVYLIRTSLRHLNTAGWPTATSHDALRQLGEAVKEAEQRRRKKIHFLLRDTTLDLNQPPEVIAASLIREGDLKHPLSAQGALGNKALRYVEANVRPVHGAVKAEELINRLRTGARIIGERHDEPGGTGSGMA